jgi:hypothetical protein
MPKKMPENSKRLASFLYTIFFFEISFKEKSTFLTNNVINVKSAKTKPEKPTFFF